MPPINTPGGPFLIQPGEDDNPWFAGNSLVGLAIFPSDDNVEPTTKLNDVPALAYVSNSFQPFAEDKTQEQTLIGELNGVFVHIKFANGRVQIVVADQRMN